MKTLAITLLFCAAASAQNLAVAVHDPTGVTADTPLTSSYQFPNTPVGGANQIVLRVTNSSAYPVVVAAIYVGNAAGSSAANPNFSITGQYLNKTLAVGAANFEDITLTFTPQVTGAIAGYLQATYQVQENGCNPASTVAATQCASTSVGLSTLSGTGIAPVLTLAYTGPSGTVTPQPNSSTPINFGNVSLSSSASLKFTFTNVSSTAVATPAVSLKTAVYFSTAFALTTSALPASIPAGSSASFTVVFSPGQAQQANATLIVGSLQYPLSGTGTAGDGINALQIFYVDSTGVRTLPQAATPIAFDDVIAGTSRTSTLTFTVTNPATSFDAVSVSTLTVSGVGFALSGAPALPVSIAPGASISFKIAFTPSSTGTYTGVFAMGARQFSLTGKGIASPVPEPSFTLSQQPLTSQQQVTLTVQLASPSPVSAIGTLTLAFKPSVANVTDDPAIVFLATNGRQLQVNVASGATTATYSSQSAITFQTGTTAGTITFTLTFPNGAPLTQSFTIAPSTVQITKANALRSNPNLVLTLTGYDNTYTAGNLSFVFYDTAGKQVTPAAISFNAASDFSTYFFTNNQAGGAFSLQATFPVTGDVTQIGSVTAQITNSAGTTSTSQTFQ